MKVLCNILILLFIMEKVSASPEVGIKTILGLLDELQSRFQSIEKINSKSNLGEVEEQAQQIYHLAKKLYTQREFYAVIQHLNIFLNAVQVPKEKNYLEAQYLLGMSYQNLGFKRKSIRAYLRYLASFVTAEEYKDTRLISVIQSLLLLTDSFSSGEFRELHAIMSSLASIKLSDNQKSRVLFYLALTSSNHNDAFFAEKLFEQSYQSTLDPQLQVENIYFSALIPLRKKDYKTAMQRFEKILTLKTHESIDYINYARLNLARIQAIQRNYHTSLSYLAMIPEDSVAYRDALYESIVLNYRIENYEESLAKAKTLIHKFPNHQYTHKILHLKGLLELRTGRTIDAQKSLTANNDNLRQFHEWLQRNYSNVDSLSYKDVKRVVSKGKFLTHTSPTLVRAMAIFDKMDQLTFHLDNIRSEIRTMVYFLGTTQPTSYQPQWKNQAVYIESLAQDTFDLGDHILNIERKLFLNKISPDLKQKLERSTKRRKLLRQQFAQKYINSRRWESWATLNGDLIRLGKIKSQLYQIQSSLSSLRFHHRKHSGRDLIESALNQVEYFHYNTNRAAEIIRSRMIKDIANQSHHMVVKSYILSYSQIIYEESILMATIRDSYDQPNEKQMSDDLQNAWQKWEYLVKSVYSSVMSLDRNVREQIQSRLNTLEKSVTTYESLKQEVYLNREKLERLLGQQSFTILNHYLSAINEQESELMKWQADNQWRQYTEISMKRKNVEEQNQNKVIKMEENLRDLDYEVKQ